MQKCSKKGKIILGLIGLFLITLSHQYFVFHFYDKSFEKAVRDYALGDTIFVGVADEFFKRETPIKGFIPQKRIKSIGNISLDLDLYEIKDLRDIKKFKNVTHFTMGIGGKGKGSGIKNNLPKNINSLSSLKHLEYVVFSDLNITAEGFKDECKPVNQMILTRCFVDNNAFIEKFPNLKFLSIDNMEISSLEFGKRLNNLESLQLLDNQYQCSLELLASFENLRTLYVKSDAPTVFTEIPPLNTVKELTLNGAGAPDKDHVTQYLEWENLERLDLNDGYYDVAAKEWHEYENQ